MNKLYLISFLLFCSCGLDSNCKDPQSETFYTIFNAKVLFDDGLTICKNDIDTAITNSSQRFIAYFVQKDRIDSFIDSLNLFAPTIIIHNSFIYCTDSYLCDGAFTLNNIEFVYNECIGNTKFVEELVRMYLFLEYGQQDYELMDPMLMFYGPNSFVGIINNDLKWELCSD